MIEQYGPMPIPLRGCWPRASAPDPVTGLVGFPEFHACLPSFLTRQADRGRLVGIAIGDVDHLKSFVEDTNVTDRAAFGHLAGNAVMSALGRICSSWFHTRRFSSGCVSTFGGDEVIVAAALHSASEFTAALSALRDRCRAQLPRSVSFAHTVITPQPGTDWTGCAAETLSAVDRALFRRKADRPRASDLGFVIDVTEVRFADVGPAA